MNNPQGPDELFTAARQWHQQNDFDRASMAYQQIIAEQADHAGAWQLYGVLLAQRGDMAGAINHIRQSITLDPHHAGAWFNLGRCYLGQHDEQQAVDCWQQCLNLDPARDDARRALIPLMLQHHTAPDQILALLAPKLTVYQDEWRWFDWAAMCNLRTGHLTEALQMTDRALALGGDPQRLAANKANLLVQIGQPQQARLLAEQILAMMPDHEGAQTALGWASLALQDYIRALDCFAPLHQNHPDDIALRLGYALACAHQDPDRAETIIRAHLDTNPEDRDYRIALGHIFTTRRDYAAAQHYYDQLLQIYPDHPGLWESLGFVTEIQDGYPLAAEIYRTALEHFPGHPGLTYGLARCALALGDGKTGWAAHEARFGLVPNIPVSPGANWPAWHVGQPVRHLVVYIEQGIGDMLQFMRYLPLLKPHAPQITLLAPARMHDFLAMQPVLRGIKLATDRDELHDADAAVSLLSLPCHVTPDIYTRPEAGYLVADAARIEDWRTRLATLPGMKIGLNWQGSKTYPLDFMRSPPLRAFEAWLDWPDVQFINLQYGYGREQLTTTGFGARITDWTDLMDRGPQAGLVDTAALLSALDLVITSDTALAHLAGALGVPCWVVLPHIADWRWGIAGPDCAWYRHQILFRQSTAGDWASVADAVNIAWHTQQYHMHKARWALMENHHDVASRYLAAMDQQYRTAEWYHLSGILAFQRGDFQHAIRDFGIAVDQSPNHPDMRGNLVLALNEAGQYQAFKPHIAWFAEHAPDHPIGLLIECWSLLHDGQIDNANQNITRLALQYPDHPSIAAAAVMIPVKNNPRLALDRALAWLDHHPDDRTMRMNAAMAAARLCDWDQAITLLEPASDPLLMLEQIRYYGFRDGPVVALSRLDDFLQRWPDDAHALTLRGHYRLAQGASKSGWADYEYRLHTGFQTPRCIMEGMNLWDGRFAPDQHLLIDEEQGIGDLFQMLRFIPLMLEKVKNITLRCKARLHPLLQFQPILQDVTITSDQHDADIAIPIMSLPHVLGVGHDIAPCRLPVMVADPGLSSIWQQRLSTLPPGRRIGLNWQGSTSYSADYLRSVPLMALSSLRDLPDVQWINLQQGFGHEQIISAGWGNILHDWTADMDRDRGMFMDTAALISQLDLVITSDTALAHLAGSLNIPTWLMTSWHPDWRWGIEGHDCPWYPSMRLFRQPAESNWTAVAHALRQALINM